MERYQTAVGVFSNHDDADKAVKVLNAGGFEMKNLSVIGNGYHTEEKVIGFYNIGDRIKFWGSRGAFWGGFWGLFSADCSSRRRPAARCSSSGFWPPPLSPPSRTRSLSAAWARRRRRSIVSAYPRTVSCNTSPTSRPIVSW